MFLLEKASHSLVLSFKITKRHIYWFAKVSETAFGQTGHEFTQSGFKKKHPIRPNVILFIRFQKKNLKELGLTTLPVTPALHTSVAQVEPIATCMDISLRCPEQIPCLVVLKITVGHSIGHIVEWQTRKLRTWMTCSRMQQKPD